MILFLLSTIILTLFISSAYFTSSCKNIAFLMPNVFIFIFYFTAPVSNIFFGESIYGVKHPEEYIIKYLASGFFFIIFYTLGFIYYSSLKSGAVTNSTLMLLNYPEKISSSTTLLIFTWALLSYIVGFARTDSLTYFLEHHNSFAQMMSLAKGSFYLVFMTSGLVYGILIILMIEINRKSYNFLKAILLTLILSSIHFYLSTPATRTWFILLFISVSFFYFGSDITSNFKKWMGLATVAILSMPTLIILNYIRQGLTISNANFSISNFLLNFAQYENALDFFAKVNSHIDYLYFKFLAAALSPISFIPSAILPFIKPRSDKEAYITEQLFGNSLDLTFYQEGSTLTYTMPVSGYADFGYIGVMVTGMLYGILIAWLHRLYISSETSKLPVLYMTVFSSTAIRFGLEGVVLVFYAFFIMYLLQYLVFSLTAAASKIRV